MKNTSMPWILFKLKEQDFAISAQNVTAISKFLGVTSFPNTPEYIRGVIKYRDEIYKLYGIRKLLKEVCSGRECEFLFNDGPEKTPPR